MSKEMISSWEWCGNVKQMCKDNAGGETEIDISGSSDFIKGSVYS